MRKIIKKIGGDRIGSGGGMTVSAHGYGYSTHNNSKVRRTSMSFGTIVPMGIWMMTTNSRIRMRLDALITSNALLYQLYGSAKFQLDVYSARMALYNPKMLLNLNDQGYEIGDIKFPQMELETEGIISAPFSTGHQVNTSALLRYLGIAYNGQNENGRAQPVTRQYNAMWLLMYYQTYKEYYANKQEKIGVMIHDEGVAKTVTEVRAWADFSDGTAGTVAGKYFSGNAPADINVGVNGAVVITGNGDVPRADDLLLWNTEPKRLTEIFDQIDLTVVGNTYQYVCQKPKTVPYWVMYWDYSEVAEGKEPKLREFDLKAIDRMQMKIMSEVETATAIIIDGTTELPYGASFRKDGNYRSINTSQEGLCIGTHQSDVFNNWLDNATINALNAKTKVKVNENGEFSINDLQLTQKLYNYDQRIGVTDGTLEEWREMTYGEVGKSKSLKPVYEGGLSKEIVFDMVVSTASTEEEPLGSIASRGQFGSKHKGGYVQIDSDEEKLVMVLAKITPRIVYNQGNDWTNNLKTLDDLHKPALDKIGYQNLNTDTMGAFETIVKADGSLTTYSAGKQPAWQWYRTNYDDALGNMADIEDYKVFGRSYESELVNNFWRIKDLTTYITPMKFNDVFAVKSLDAMNFDVQVGMDVTQTLVMSEEVIPQI